MNDYCCCAGKFTHTLSKQSLMEQMMTFRNIARFVCVCVCVLSVYNYNFSSLEQRSLYHAIHSQTLIKGIPLPCIK